MGVRAEIKWVKENLSTKMEIGIQHHTPIIVMIAENDIMKMKPAENGPPITWVPLAKAGNTFTITMNLLAEATQGNMVLVIELSGHPWTAMKKNHPEITSRIQSLQTRWPDAKILTSDAQVNKTLGITNTPGTARLRYKKKNVIQYLRRHIRQWIKPGKNTVIIGTRNIWMKKTLKLLGQEGNQEKTG